MKYGNRYKDTSAILMNLTQNISFSAKNHEHGGIDCHEDQGPVFGKWELAVYPNCKQGELWSFVGRSGFKIPGKVGQTNPLTGDEIVEN